MRAWTRGLPMLAVAGMIWSWVGVAEGQLFGPKATVTSPDGKSIDEAQAEAYDGPKARVAVSQFKDKTGKGWWTGAIGDGMADMLSTALFHSNRYIVLERQQVSDVLREQDLGASGRIKKGTEAPVGEIEGAELLITGAVTEFEGAASGGGGGIGGIGGLGTAGRIIGGIAGGIKKAHMAIDMRVIDTRTSRIVAATSVEGEATDFALGGALAGAGSGGALGGALGGWSKTPTEKALRLCIQEAVKFIVAKTPTTYYHYGASGQKVAAAQRAPVAAAGGASGGGATTVAATAPADATGTPAALRVIQTIKADQDKTLLADLNEAKVRGATLSVVVTLRHTGSKPSAWVLLNEKKSGVMNYDTGETAETIKLDDQVNSALKPGEIRTVRAVFKVPKGAKKVAITFGGVGTFDDVELGQ
jgi:curli biogenesis system outer membrane secretion channel CsgG